MPDAKRKQKPEVSIIGAGRLGTTLAVALARQGLRDPIAGRAPARKVHAKRRSLLDADVQVLAAKQLRSLTAADLFLITVPDDQIAAVARELSET